MNNIERFAAYAAAFEKAYVGNDWAEVATFFAEDAVYEIGLSLLGQERAVGRDDIIAWFTTVLDRFDRRFASRKLILRDGPREEGDTVWIGGFATYGAPGVPSFDLYLTESIRYENGLIVHLQDHYTPEMIQDTIDYLGRYGQQLGFQP